MKTLIVGGALANKCGNGGEAWVRLSWVLGLKQLGFEVFFLEQLHPDTCLDAAGNPSEFHRSTNLDYFKRVTQEFGLSRSSALIYDEGKESYGLEPRQILDLASDAELLVNISGHLSWPALLDRVRRKAYIDIDPGFTQFWHAAGLGKLGLSLHDFYYTIGENIGHPDCTIPTNGLKWRQIRQPVVLEHWPCSAPSAFDRFTTVATWRCPFGPVSWQGRSYGLKVHEFRRFINLPREAEQDFEISLNIHPADRADLEGLQEHGWQIVDPSRVAHDPPSFRNYVQTSGAEFSVAQGVYVETQNGWFSDRSVRYLASGKPVLVQDTGFSRRLPVGLGLVSFRNRKEAVAGAESIAAHYSEHCRAARRIAEDHFDSRQILGRLLEETGTAH